MPTTILDLPIDSIVVPKSHRPLREDKLEALAESMRSAKSPHQPIMVRKPRDAYVLVFGGHRLAAGKRLKWKTIPCLVTTMGEDECELAEIDENLMRAQLTLAQESIALSRRKELYLKLHPETAQGTAGALAKAKSANDTVSFAETNKDSGGRHKSPPANDTVSPTDTPSFAADAAAKTGKSERTVQRRVAIGENLSQKAADILDSHPAADSQREVAALAELPKADQVAVAKSIASGESATVKEALAVRVDAEEENLATSVMLAMNTDKIKPTPEQRKALGKLPESKQNAIMKAVAGGATLAQAMKASGEKAAEKPSKQSAAKPGETKSDVRVWTEVEGCLGKAINRTDDLNKNFPNSAMHRKLLDEIKTALRTLKEWRKAS